MRENIFSKILFIILISFLVFNGCASVSQSLRGEPELAPSDKEKLISNYTGKTAWLKYPKYEKEGLPSFAFEKKHKMHFPLGLK